MTLSLLADTASWISFIVGGFFLFIGSLGMVRLPDFWSRLHAASVLDSAGLGLLLFGMMFQAGFSFVTIKLVLIIIFLLITAPTASHAVANAAFVSGSRPLDGTADKGIFEEEDEINSGQEMRKTPEKPKVP